MPSPENSSNVESEHENLTSAKQLFALFLSRNPYSSIESVPEEPRLVFISTPWGDKSIEIRLREDSTKIQELANALNNAVLPVKYSAIYHEDTRSLEVIWSAATLSERYEDIRGRKFDFVFNEISYQCEFGPSSDRLIVIARHSAPVETSDTNFRHLSSYALYARMIEMGTGEEKDFSEDGPTSFWIRNIEYDENLDHVVSNLNFYMRYFDDRSPIVLVHENVQSNFSNRTRYVKGVFPKKIKSKPLDENLLSFWNFTGREPNLNPMISFILYYRVIEYAAFHYIDHKIKIDLKKIIMAPDFSPENPATLEKIVGTLGPSKLEDIGRFRSVIRDCVSPSVLWPDVKANLQFFSTDAHFDGGFVIKAFINNKETEATFDHNRIHSFAESIRRIRNTLSHGKDQETAGVITPTSRNFSLLIPWLHLIATAAGEVVLHKDIT